MVALNELWINLADMFSLAEGIGLKQHLIT